MQAAHVYLCLSCNNSEGDEAAEVYGMVFPVSSLFNVPSLDLLPVKVSEAAEQQPLSDLRNTDLCMFECVLSHQQIQRMVPRFARP